MAGALAHQEDPQGSGDAGKVAPNLRTFMILEVLGRADGPMTASEIHRALGLPKQTIHRLCNAMEAEGILVRDPGVRGLRPGRRARLIASGILSTAHAPIARHQVLMSIAREAGETVNLVVPQEKGMFYLDRVETDWPIRVQLPIGTHVPFHCTASGKVFMSSLKGPARAKLVANLSLERLTKNTITEPEALLREIEQVAAQGYAIDDQEFVQDMAAIAVPIYDAGGQFFAALAIHGPTQRFPASTALATKELLLQSAERLGGVLF